MTAAAQAAATFRHIANTAVDVLVKRNPPPWPEIFRADLAQMATIDAGESLHRIRNLISRDDLAGYRRLIADAVETRLTEHALKLERRRRKSMAR